MFVNGRMQWAACIYCAASANKCLSRSQITFARRALHLYRCLPCKTCLIRERYLCSPTAVACTGGSRWKHRTRLQNSLGLRHASHKLYRQPATMQHVAASTQAIALEERQTTRAVSASACLLPLLSASSCFTKCKACTWCCCRSCATFRECIKRTKTWH